MAEENGIEGQEQVEQPRITAKQRVLEARGQEVPVDYFLFSCLEHERLLRAREAKGAPRVAWPVLPKTDDAPPNQEIDGMEIGSLLDRLCSWYRDEYSPLSETRPLDHEQLNQVLSPIVSLNRDIAQLYWVKVGQELPEFDKSVADNQVWNQIAAALQSYFPTYQHYFVRYLQWSHAVEPKEVVEPGSRPPVGRYAPPPLPRTGGPGGRSGPGGGRGGDRGPRGGSDRGGFGGGGRDRGPRGDSFKAREPRDEDHNGGQPEEAANGESHEGRPAAGARESRGPRSDRGDRGDRGGGDRGGRDRGGRDRGGRDRDRGDRGGRGRGENDEATQRLTEVALTEVDQAIAQLNSNSSLESVTLKPTNSFYRRIQHQKIVDSGFHSFSVGEGPERAVKVARKED